MLTPRFSITQDDTYLYLKIHVPYLKISDVELDFGDLVFRFYCKPYFLRLVFNSPIVEDGRESARYDGDEGVINIMIPKKNTGEHFTGLDMITSLLSVPKEKIASGIEEIGDLEDLEPAEEIDSVLKPYYGFDHGFCDMLRSFTEDLKEIFELPDPEQNKRREMRIATEDEKFDPEIYAGCFADRAEIDPMLEYEPWWNTINTDAEWQWTDEEKDAMMALKNREYLLKDERAVWMSLIDILWGYVYDHRTTMGDSTVESSWTVSRLSSTLSWFDKFHNSNDVVTSCCRRTLIYPLYRNWQCNVACLLDLKFLVKNGRHAILRALLATRKLFEGSDYRYIVNRMYIDHYCVWIQKVSQGALDGFIGEVSLLRLPDKDSIGLGDLTVYEEMTTGAEILEDS